MSRPAVLGYHHFGDFHYFSVLAGKHRHFGETLDGEFNTHEEFASLIVAVHEHYHLMQGLQQGFFWWRHRARENFLAFSMAGLETVATIPDAPLLRRPTADDLAIEVDASDPLSFARKYFGELLQLERSVHRPNLTRSLLADDLANTEDGATFVAPEAFELTIADLVECHAAVLTELYVSRLLSQRPGHFDSAVVADLAGLFRIPQMQPMYGRPLRVLLHLCERLGLRLELPKGHIHPIYRGLQHGPIYLLLAFLLDYALHIPPEPLLLMSEVPDAGTLQDIWPPIRFFNLALQWTTGVRTNREHSAELLLSEPKFYSDVAPLLARWINEMHARVREPGTRETFSALADTTRKWRASENDWACRGLFPDVDAVRTVAEELRERKPAMWFDLAPLQFDLEVGLPRLFITHQGLGTAPYLADTDGRLSRMSNAELTAHLQRAATLHYGGFSSGKWDSAGDLPITIVPFRFIEQVMSGEMSHRIAARYLFGDSIRCPLTEALGAFVPCVHRTRQCESLNDIRALPQEGCLLRATFQAHFRRNDQ